MLSHEKVHTTTVWSNSLAPQCLQGTAACWHSCRDANRLSQRASSPIVCWVATETISAEMKLGTL